MNHVRDKYYQLIYWMLILQNFERVPDNEDA